MDQEYRQTEARAGRGVIQAVNPFRCRMWSLHDRLEDYVTEENCKAEIESVTRHGQMVPVLARKLRDDPTHDYELIYGARRLFVLRHLNQQLLVEVRDMTDREAVAAMDIENRHRQDISPYERGLSYTRWLRSGCFSSQDDIARTLKISASQVSRLLKLARLPTVIIDAFGDANEICEVWGVDLAETMEDPQRRASIIRTARALSQKTPRLNAVSVYQELRLAGQPARKVKKLTHDEIVRDGSGAPLFRVRYQRNAIAIVLPIERLSPICLGSIRKAVSDAIQQQDNHTGKAAETGVSVLFAERERLLTPELVGAT